MPSHDDSSHDPIRGAVHTVHGLHTGVDIAEQFMHHARPASAVHHAAAGTGAFGSSMGALGMVLGGFGLAEGVCKMANGEGSQGMLDATSGGLGFLSGAETLAGVASPAFAIPAAIAALAAYGNPTAEANGWYGTQTDEAGREVNQSFLGSMGDTAAQGWELGHLLYGDNAIGDITGGTLGAVGGFGRGVINTGKALGGAMSRGGEMLADGAVGAIDAYGAMNPGLGSMTDQVFHSPGVAEAAANAVVSLMEYL
jgi:hypothetical protein